ncbi:hypothetical protein BDF22DRAFT_493688 [Syncephalis plumigaleata]|nr:hypothetical protein BDF22DRAFT_493688 [Syncephalis plumigaleata]
MHIFRNTTMPLVQDLLKRGRDALVLAYGVTNSGKTFTVQGDRTNPGMLPRSLNTLFSTIEDRMTDLKMRPVRFCEVELCDDLTPDSAESVIRAASANRPKRANRKEPPLTVEVWPPM